MEKPGNRGFLIFAEIMTCFAAKQAVNSVEILPGLLTQSVGLLVERFQVSGVLEKLRGHLLHGEDMIDKPGGNRAAQDGIELSGFQGLGYSHSAMFLDRPQTDGPIRPHAGQHDADGVFSAILRQ